MNANCRANMAQIAAAAVVAAALFAAPGCRTVNDVLVDYRDNVSGGNYAAASLPS